MPSMFDEVVSVCLQKPWVAHAFWPGILVPEIEFWQQCWQPEWCLCLSQEKWPLAATCSEFPQEFLALSSLDSLWPKVRVGLVSQLSPWTLQVVALHKRNENPDFLLWFVFFISRFNYYLLTGKQTDLQRRQSLASFSHPFLHSSLGGRQCTWLWVLDIAMVWPGCHSLSSCLKVPLWNIKLLWARKRRDCLPPVEAQGLACW